LSSAFLTCGGLNSAHASLNTGLSLHILLSFRWLFPFFLRRFLYPILDPLAFVPNAFYTHNLSKYCLFQTLSQYGLFQNPGLHTCLGSNLSPSTMLYTKTMFLLGLCKVCLQLAGSLFPWWRAEHAEDG
jgi:hypothetical protein